MKYRVITNRLRIRRPGLEDLVVARPMKKVRADGVEIYTDSDSEPTLVDIDDTCHVDANYLIRIGAIAVYEEAPGG